MSSPGYTVFGASGAVGSALVAALRARGEGVCAVRRGDEPPAQPWGRAIYAVGVTADFRTRPEACVEAHAGYAARLLRGGTYETFTYLSSTRIYRDGPTSERGAVPLDPADADRIYDLSKLFGEALVLEIAGPAARIARLSNVVPEAPEGPAFLADVVREARATGRVTIRSAPGSAKDYIASADAVEGILRLAAYGEPLVCNVASGRNVDVATLAGLLREHAGAEVAIEEGAPLRSATPIRIETLRERLGFEPGDPVPAIVRLMKG